MKKSGERKPLVERFFQHFGLFVAQHAWCFIVGPVILTGVMCIGFHHTEIDRHLVQLFYPKQQDGYYERLTSLNYTPLTEEGYYRVSLLALK